MNDVLEELQRLSVLISRIPAEAPDQCCVVDVA